MYINQIIENKQDMRTPMTGSMHLWNDPELSRKKYKKWRTTYYSQSIAGETKDTVTLL